MKKIIELLHAHGIEVFHAQDKEIIHGDQNQEIIINHWDIEEVLDFLGYDPMTIEQMLYR